MLTVYNLVLIDSESSYDDHNEEFNIGFFSARSAAEKTAEKSYPEFSAFLTVPT